ncbi:polysaccharide biosynthesis tyrosine autokinase [Demequina aurantiaca]|uniref:polysaccharide biosynthesis tyrosine autokinase n=1 Tax=Demequina aurantiaca TaxID=676200 RepID=UPI003D3444D6
MDLRDYANMLRKNWWLIAIAAGLGMAVALAYSLVATPLYGASAKVFVSTSSVTSVTDLQQGSSFTLQRVKTYADLVGTSAVLQPVIDQLGISVSVADLRQQVSASSPLNTTVIDINVSQEDPVFAASLATAVAEQLAAVVEDIETTDASSGSPVQLTVVQEAEVSTQPTSPNTTLNLAMGLLLGLALGVGIALLRHTLDRRVRNERDLGLLTDTPILGGIVFDPKAKERPLIVHADPRSPRSESFRTLRTNLQFLDTERADRSFVVTSSIQSEGKSTTAANLAISIADSGVRVLLVDADLRDPKISTYMAVEGGVGLSDAIIGRARAADLVQRWGETTLHLLPAGRIPPNPSELLGSGAMMAIIQDLGAEYDVVLYDSPPLLPVTDAAVLARHVGGALLVVAAGRVHSAQVGAALSALENVGAKASGIVLTMLPTKGPDAYGYGHYGHAYGNSPQSNE